MAFTLGAALLANAIKAFSATSQCQRGAAKANVRSGVSLMTLGVRPWRRGRLLASGTDARAALNAMARAPRSRRCARVADGAVAQAAFPRKSGDPGKSSRSFAAYRQQWHRCRAGGANRPAGNIDCRDRRRHRSFENSRLDSALHERARKNRGAGIELDRTWRRSDGGASRFIDDPELLDATRTLIARGKSAAFAWRRAIDDVIATLRAVDAHASPSASTTWTISDSDALSFEGKNADLDLPERAIVLAKELAASQSRACAREMAASVPRRRTDVACGNLDRPPAFQPSLRGAGGSFRAGRAEVFLNADRGSCTSRERGRAARGGIDDARASRANARGAQPCARRMPHGRRTRIEVFANVGSLAEAKLGWNTVRRAAACCARNFCFSIVIRRRARRSNANSIKRSSMRCGAAVILRTLDAGGDKRSPICLYRAKRIPLLDFAGVRTSLHRPDLLETQLKAALAVASAGLCKVMLPMINSVAEIRAVRQVLEDLRRTINVPARRSGS